MDTRMPKRTPEHVLETSSRNYLLNVLPSEWIVRDFNPDYGIDLIVEVVEEGLVTGWVFLVQIKATRQLDIRCRGNPRVRVPVKTLYYLRNTHIFSMLILYEELNNCAWWRWLNSDLFDEMDEHLPKWRKQETTTIRFDPEKVLTRQAIRAIGKDLQSLYTALSDKDRRGALRRYAFLLMDRIQFAGILVKDLQISYVARDWKMLRKQYKDQRRFLVDARHALRRPFPESDALITNGLFATFSKHFDGILPALDGRFRRKDFESYMQRLAEFSDQVPKLSKGQVAADPKLGEELVALDAVIQGVLASLRNLAFGDQTSKT